MDTRVLGRTGLRITAVSIGGWLTYGNTVEAANAKAILRRALDLGVNHVDTADVYAQGQCESVLGEALDGVRRASYVLASKVFWPTGPGPNDRGLSRKHVHESCEASLRRLRTDYLDLYYCHRYDPEVPLEETVRAMEDLAARGRILHWGVSCWTSAQIAEACRLATRHKPVVNQPPYNVFDRHIEKDVLGACAREGLGVVVWSPLAQGVLTGKYLDAMPADSRAANEKVNKFMQKYLTPEMTAVVRRLASIAREAGLTPGQLALGWCLRRPEVTSVIVGATKLAQLEENAKAAPLAPDVLRAVEAAVRDAPQVDAV
jgi:aryl-alcohol dehydrogenase-like predicted oxidoreductase